MTTVTFHTRKGRINGFSASGHSGWDDAGKDIVCAAITSAIRLVEATVNDVLGLAAAVNVREDAAEDMVSLAFRLPGGLEPGTENTCQTLLTGLMVYFVQLHGEYPEAVQVQEDQEAVPAAARRKDRESARNRNHFL